MGKLADLVHQENKPRIFQTPPTKPLEGDPVFTSDKFHGFSAFLQKEDTEPILSEEEKKAEKLKKFKPLLRMILEMFQELN